MTMSRTAMELELTGLIYGSPPDQAFHVRLSSPAASLLELRDSAATALASVMSGGRVNDPILPKLTAAVAADMVIWRIDNEMLVPEDSRLRLLAILDQPEELPPIQEVFNVTLVPAKERSPALAWFPTCRAHSSTTALSRIRIDFLVILPHPKNVYVAPSEA
ncbi:hypothetical protein HK104_004362, partial [Borealophlyctis nickersoniae]